MTDQEAALIDIGKEADAFASWPTRERLRALKRIIPRARVEEVLARTGRDRAHCPRLPGWFMVWFVIALGLFCRDCYRQVFRWLQPFRKGGTPRRTTLCEARVLALCETGSHVLWRCLIKPCSCGEVTMTHYLLRFLRPDMLLLWDRNFLSYQTVSEVRQRKAHLLARIKKNLIFEPIRVLNDGSYLSKIYRNSADRKKDRNGILVRIIEYTFDDPGRPGSGEPHRLLTTLLDEKLDPAGTLIVGYHERWEEELPIDELKTHQRERPVLRSQTPGGVVQELYGLLLGHYVIRVLMQEAAATKGIDPRRLSFTGTLKILRCRLPECPASRRGRSQWYHNLVAEIAEEVLEDRRNRINPRVIKRKMSNWRKKRPEHRNYPRPTKKFGEAIVMRR